MVQKSSETKIRKLPLPLEIKVGNDTVITDGLFSLTSKEASQIKITSVDEDGYVTCEIFPPQHQRPTSKSLTDIFSDALIGTESSKTCGRGENFGQYKYYRRPDGSFYAIVSGVRPRKLQLGKPTDRHSSISIVARTIKHSFNTNEFSKKQLLPLLSKKLGHGQMLKSVLDVMKIEGYLEKRETKTRGRLKELFRATEKLSQIVIAIPEQA